MTNFDEIRPYRDNEIGEVLNRILNTPQFEAIIAFIFPNENPEDIKARARALKSIHELQVLFSFNAVARMIHDSTDGLSLSGLDELPANEAYLFISNHRDIILDSAFLSYKLVEAGRETVEIGTGDNLFFSPIVADMMRLNRSFKIHRNLTPRELHSYSVRLSEYIRQRVSQDHASVWIAQRNGRTKDGDDQTETGLLKMLGLSGEDFLTGFRELNIVPMAISYELDPCDRFKARELYHRHTGMPFQKSEAEDFLNMQAGIFDPKGRVHIALGEVLDQELESLAEMVNKNDRFRAFTDLLDSKIQGLFRLFPNNYIAADMLHGDQRFRQHYTDLEQQAFENHIDEMCRKVKNDKTALLPFLLNIYAKPVENRIMAGLPEAGM